MAKRLQNFIESVYQDGKPNIDREAGVIRNVKILGPQSKNDNHGRTYSDQALKEAAAIYEGLGVNANHPDRATPNRSRGVEEGVGWLENVTVKPGQGVYGDLHLIKAHPLTNTLFEVAERKPDRFGLSHNASGDVSERAGKRIVESIKSVRSVDIVQNPATVNSLFESEDNVATRTLSDLLEEMKPGKDKTKLQTIIEMDGMPMPADVPVMPSDEGDTADPYRDAIRSLLLAVYDDESLDAAGKLAKIKTLLGLEGEITDSPAPTDKPTEDAPVPESTETPQDKRIRLLEEMLADKDATEDARTFLESAKVKVTPARVSTLKATTDKGIRKELVEDWLKADGPAPKQEVPRPKFSKPAPLVESQDSDNKYPETQKDFLRSIGAKVPASA